MNILGPLMNNYNLYKWESETSDLSLNDSNQDYMDITIRKYEKHPSIQINSRIHRIYRILEFQSENSFFYKWKIPRLHKIS